MPFCTLGVVGGWGGGVGAAGREGPADHARLGLLDFPVGCLLAAVMRPALRAEVAFVARPVGVGDGVVEVGVDGLGGAAGSVAGRGAGVDQVPQLAAGGVVVFGVPVVAGAACDRLEGEV